MKKIIMGLICTALFSSSAFAATGGCVGTYQGRKIIFNGLILDPMNKNTAEGYISVNGRRVADFDGEDLRINYLFQTFKASNGRGDLVDGKVTSLMRKTGVIKRLYVRGFGIDYRNIPMQCWTK